MACGDCAHRRGDVRLQGVDAVAEREVSARAVMCWACPQREGSLCGSMPVTLRVLAGHCPAGYFVPGGGMRWLGVRWMGLPAVLRIAVRWLRPEGRAGTRPFGYWPGCGCVARLKTAWMRWKRRMDEAVSAD